MVKKFYQKDAQSKQPTMFELFLPLIVISLKKLPKIETRELEWQQNSINAFTKRLLRRENSVINLRFCFFLSRASMQKQEERGQNKKLGLHRCCCCRCCRSLFVQLPRTKGKQQSIPKWGFQQQQQQQKPSKQYNLITD